ncbi:MULTISPECIES: sarcosine oxidase subunit gamma [Acidiphilium]|uniref:sarcosine oxidase subunit gamma n=1 Tax=Acidiphilium TaxID=522 RepID=UPI000460FDE7|nr:MULTISPECIES: sarcosine oxidase subunit gamma family protein [Acidiphilium]KDM67788.1 sarcosine oxidase, gamma subunit [Acidiphilium sp. JA12-A1]MBS3025313.1 sarcosine oxidase subunit gamma [Acidiphilium multivorum]
MDNLAEKASLSRLFALSGQGGDRRCRPVTEGARFSLRVKQASVGAAGEALGLDLTGPINRAVSAGQRTALRLGPDEWLLLLAEVDAASVAVSLAQRLTDEFYSLADISHRQTGIALEGAAVIDLLNGGCPLDLDLAAFPVGMATRTIFFKVEIVLWRQDTARFHMEVWRSFAPYAWSLLANVGREYAD